MNRSSRIAAAAALLLIGGAAGHALTTVPSVAPAATAPRASQAAGKTSVDLAASMKAPTSAATSAIDAATEHAYAVASPSVVFINNVGVGSGSGVVYDTHGDIVTNAHVVDQAQSLKVTLSTGKSYSAKVLGTDTADDLAVIHIDAANTPAATFVPSAQYHVAETVLAIGNPLDLQQSVSSGLVSALNRTVQEQNGAYLPDAIQTSAPINPGNSGGALVDLNGQVVGIPTLEATDPQNNNGGAAQGVGFAVPSTRVTLVANQIIASGRVAHTGRAYLGVSATDPQSQQGNGFGGGFGGGYFGGGNATPTVSGAVVENVASGSPADQAGVQQGDVITALGGTSISGQDDLLQALAHQKPGAKVTITVNRNGQTLNLSATLGELSASQ